MNSPLNPADVMPPFNNAYSHGVVIPPGAKVLHTAGQIGARADGTVPMDAGEQAAQLWRNLLAILREAGMEATDIVKVTAYVVGVEHYAAYAAARVAALGTARPAATAVCVPALLKPEWLFEAELIAAR